MEKTIANLTRVMDEMLQQANAATNVQDMVAL